MNRTAALILLTLGLGVASSLFADLPAGYTELEWIESNGAQAIRTDYTPDFTDRFVMRFRFQDQLVTGYDSTAKKRTWKKSTRCFFCARVSSSATMTLFYLNTGVLRMDYNNSNKSASSYDLQPGDHVYEFDGSTRVGKMDGTTLFSGWSAKTGSVGAKLMLFHSHLNGGTVENANVCRLYRFTVYDKDGNLKLDLVPARDDNATDMRRRHGLYDLVGGTFITNDFPCGGGFGAGEKRSSVVSWTGGAGDGKWSSNGNWTNATGAACVPANGDSLEIPVSADTTMQNDISGLSLGPVYFRNRGSKVTLTGESLTLKGEPRWAAEGTVELKVPLVFGGTARYGVVLSNMATNYVTEAVSGTGGMSMSGYGSIVQFQKSVTFAGGTEINAGYVWVTNLTSFGSSTIYINNDVAKHNNELMQVHAAGLWLQTDSFSTALHLGPASGTKPPSSYSAAYGAGYNVQLMRTGMVCTSPVTGEADCLFSPRCAAYWASHDHSNAIRAQPVYYDGDVDIPNGNAFFFQFQGTGSNRAGFMQMRGALKAKTVTYSDSGNGEIFYMNAGNAIGDIYPNYMHFMGNGVAHAFGGAVVRVTQNSKYSGNQIALGSADQTIDRIVCANYLATAEATDVKVRNCSGGQIRSPTTGNDDAVTPAGFPRLVMRATGHSTVDFRFYNKVALVWWPTDAAHAMTCTNRVSETTGEIVVSNGVFRLAKGATFAKSRFVEVAPGATFCDATDADYALASITNLSVGAGGRFYSETGVISFPGSGIHLNFDGEGDGFGRLELPDDATIVPDAITTNGVAIRPGVYTGADGVAGATKVPWLRGACRVTLASGAAAATWTGLAPSTDDIHAPQNWDVNEDVNLVSGAFVGTFAQSGERADVGDAIGVNSFLFDLPGSSFLFRKTSDDAQISFGTGGITLSAATPKAVTNEVPAVIAASQPWTVGAAGRFVQKGGLRGLANTSYTLTHRGDYGGVLEIDARDAPGDFPGSVSCLSTTATTLVLKGDDPLGPSTSDIPFWLTSTYGDVPWYPSGTIGLGAEKTGVFYPGNAQDLTHRHVQLAGTRITKQTQFAASCRIRSVCSMAGTTNEFAASCKMEHAEYITIENASKLVFSGGLIGRYVSQGGGDFIFYLGGASTVAFTKRPFYSPAGAFLPYAASDTWTQAHTRFAVSTNMLCWIHPNGSEAMGIIDCDAPDVFAGKTQITLSAKSALDLHGRDQRIAAIHEVAAGAAIRSEAPATLFVNNVTNTTINAYTGTTAANGKMKGAFEGCVSVVKKGNIPLVLSGASTSTGSLAVDAGKVVFAAGGSWTGAPRVTVAAGATLEVDHAGALSRDVELAVAAGGTLNLNGDFRLRVKSLNGHLVAPGTYSASRQPAGVTITGPGSLVVRSGLILTVW